MGTPTRLDGFCDRHAQVSVAAANTYYPLVPAQAQGAYIGYVTVSYGGAGTVLFTLQDPTGDQWLNTSIPGPNQTIVIPLRIVSYVELGTLFTVAGATVTAAWRAL